MAQDPSKTEKATPKRRAKAREEGSLLRVADLDATIVLWGNFFMFLALGATTITLMGQQMAYFLRKSCVPGTVSQGNLHSLAVDLFTVLLRIVLPFLAANLLIALANQMVQHGFKLNTKALVPKFSRINPAGGFKRIISPKAVVDIIKSLFKFFLIGWMTWSVVAPRMPEILATMHLSLNQSLGFFQHTLFVLYRNIMLVMIGLAGADWFYQRHVFEEGLKMSKQEVREESKDADGNPEIKAKQKSMLMASAMRRILTQVPKASVVITNPTHFAVALRYDEATAAPVLIAKGVDHLALKIRERARNAGVVIVENPPLARAIYHNVGLDQPIPAELYQAVAQVLAYVYRLKGAA
jgi:flagellar biosynthetic protein FlhB